MKKLKVTEDTFHHLEKLIYITWFINCLMLFGYESIFGKLLLVTSTFYMIFVLFFTEVENKNE